MISYTYKILSLKKQDDDFLNNIKSFKIRITGTKDAESHYIDKELILSMPGVESFIDYENLIEQILIDWFADGIRELGPKHEIEKKFNLNLGTETTTFPWSI